MQGKTLPDITESPFALLETSLQIKEIVQKKPQNFKDCLSEPTLSVKAGGNCSHQVSEIGDASGRAFFFNHDSMRGMLKKLKKVMRRVWKPMVMELLLG